MIHCLFLQKTYKTQFIFDTKIVVGKIVGRPLEKINTRQ